MKPVTNVALLLGIGALGALSFITNAPKATAGQSFPAYYEHDHYCECYTSPETDGAALCDCQWGGAGHTAYQPYGSYYTGWTGCVQESFTCGTAPAGSGPSGTSSLSSIDGVEWGYRAYAAGAYIGITASSKYGYNIYGSYVGYNTHRALTGEWGRLSASGVGWSNAFRQAAIRAVAAGHSYRVGASGSAGLWASNSNYVRETF